MKSDEERKKSSALMQTVLLCIATEVIALLLLRVILGTFGEAAFALFLVVGPASLWLAAPLYRYLLRANH